MAADKEWVAVYRVVLEALADVDVLQSPPRTEEEVGFSAETISDHILGASGQSLGDNNGSVAPTRMCRTRSVMPSASRAGSRRAADPDVGATPIRAGGVGGL